jgi:hypothetical protein
MKRRAKATAKPRPLRCIPSIRNGFSEHGRQVAVKIDAEMLEDVQVHAHFESWGLPARHAVSGNYPHGSVSSVVVRDERRWFSVAGGVLEVEQHGELRLPPNWLGSRLPPRDRFGCHVEQSRQVRLAEAHRLAREAQLFAIDRFDLGKNCYRSL